MSFLSDDNLLYAIEKGGEALREFLGEDEPVAAIILGSGLNPFAETLEDARILSFESVPFMEMSTAFAHKGRFVLGTVPGTDRRLLCMQGRLHKYEGFTAMQVAFPVWLLAECGISTLITTNAAGAINRDLRVGDFCLMSDQLNLTGTNPLVGRSTDLMANRYVSMYECFDPQLREIAHSVAQREGVSVKEGVYAGLLGPSFETPAEIRMLATLGADTVAMSVVEEVIVARHAGMRVLGMSLITNMGCGIEGADLLADDIMEVAARSEASFSRLIAGIIAAL